MMAYIYAGISKSLVSRYENYMELFNEFCVTVCTTHIIFFTDYIDNEDRKF